LARVTATGAVAEWPAAAAAATAGQSMHQIASTREEPTRFTRFALGRSPVSPRTPR
jgi:hypothetical protein